MSIAKVDTYKQLANQAVKWGNGEIEARPGTPLGELIERAGLDDPNDDDVDRGFWVGEILGVIAADARKAMDAGSITSLEWTVVYGHIQSAEDDWHRAEARRDRSRVTPAERNEDLVRRALKGVDESVGRSIERSPQAVVSSDSPRMRRLNWTTPSPDKVMVLTEYGIGDPYQYEHVHEAFDAAAAILSGQTGKKWTWDSINPAVHYFTIEDDRRVNPTRRKNPHRDSTYQRTGGDDSRDANMGDGERKALIKGAARRRRDVRFGIDLGYDNRREGQDGRGLGAFSYSTLSARRNPGGEDLELAKAKYDEFHRYPPTKIGEFARGFEIPHKMLVGGKAKWTTYRSGKVDPSTLKLPKNPINYIHEHDAGVAVYLPRTQDIIEMIDASGDEVKEIRVPDEFTRADALVCLGRNLGYCFELGDEEVEAVGEDPLPELYCVPSGKCLIVVQDKREVLAMIWGGALGVFARGIDG